MLVRFDVSLCICVLPEYARWQRQDLWWEFRFRDYCGPEFIARCFSDAVVRGIIINFLVEEVEDRLSCDLC